MRLCISASPWWPRALLSPGQAPKLLTLSHRLAGGASVGGQFHRGGDGRLLHEHSLARPVHVLLWGPWLFYPLFYPEHPAAFAGNGVAVDELPRAQVEVRFKKEICLVRMS